MTDIIGKTIGRYQVRELLGQGGMAIVYKAFDTTLEREVALKLIRTERLTLESAPKALKRFDREVKALARLTHPNIVPVSDFGHYEEMPFLVMPFLPGGTLKQFLGKPVAWQDAAQLLIPVAEALAFAHSQDIIHRDVKPSNILLTQAGQPMLTDFGIAKVLDLEDTLDLTGTSTAVGTPEYMAPELATDPSVDCRLDIYSLGIVLYELVTGRKPFTAPTPTGVMIKHATEPLPSPRSFVPSLPVEVEKVLIKALAKKPSERFQSMTEFVIDLRRLTGLRAARPLSAHAQPPAPFEAATTTVLQSIPAPRPQPQPGFHPSRNLMIVLGAGALVVITLAFLAVGAGAAIFGARQAAQPESTAVTVPSPLPADTPIAKPTSTRPPRATSSPLPPPSMDVTIASNNTRMRSGPDLRFGPVHDYPAGALCEVTGIYKEWLKVRCSDGGEGWLHKDWLSIPGDFDFNLVKDIPESSLVWPTPCLKQKYCK